MICCRLCICVLCLQCELPCASSGIHLFQKTCHKLHNCMALPQCEWAGAHWNAHFGWRTCYTVHTYRVSLQYGCVYVSSTLYLLQKTSHRFHTCAALLFQCEWVDVSWDMHIDWMTCRTVRIWRASFHCGVSCASSCFHLYEIICHTGHICETSLEWQLDNSLRFQIWDLTMTKKAQIFWCQLAIAY